MTSADMVEEIDAVIARLTQARAILAATLLTQNDSSRRRLAARPEQTQATAEPTSADAREPETPAVPVQRVEPRTKRERRAPRRAKPAPPVALSSPVPHGPVAVSAADAAARHRPSLVAPSAGREHGKAHAASGTLDELLREYAPEHRAG